MDVHLCSLKMVLFYILAELSHYLIRVTLHLIENPICKDVSHSNNLVLCNVLLIDMVQVLQLWDEVVLVDVSIYDCTLPVVHHLARLVVGSLVVPRALLGPRARSIVLHISLALLDLLPSLVHLQLALVSALTSFALPALTSSPSRWNLVGLFLIQVDEYLLEELVIHELCDLFEDLSNVL